MTGEKITGPVEAVAASTGVLQVLGQEAIRFGQDIQLAGDVGQNTSGGGADADFEEDAPRTPQKVSPFAGFSDS